MLYTSLSNLGYKGCIVLFKLLLKVQNSQSSAPTIAKLLEVDADLATQEVELSAQLTSIQEKRYSLKTVIDMFAPAPTADTVPVAKPVTEERSQPSASDTESEAPAAPLPQKRQAKKNAALTSSEQSQKSAPVKKRSEAPNTWQQYVKDEFSNATLSEAVSEVMQQRSELVLEIATIIDSIFVNDIPKEIRSTARERISNVLSVGSKSGKWYRGQLGKYSMSKAAV